MIQPLATVGLVAAVLSLGDRRVPETRSIGTVVSLVAVAETAPAQERPPVRPPADTQAPARTSTQAASARRTVTIAVKGMTCGGCVLGTRKVLTRLPGVTEADVSYEKGTAVVTYDPAKVTVEQMIAAIRTLGYTASVVVPKAG